MGIVDYGVFVEIEPGVEGLVHVSEMTWNKRKQHPSEALVQEGDSVDAVVLEVKPEQRRISLKKPETGTRRRRTRGRSWRKSIPWARKSLVRCAALPTTARSWRSRPGFDGLIHASDISWTGRMKNPQRSVQEGGNRLRQSAED